ncbi:hypothetical protein E2L06_04125 [Haloterrigena sp. H1]|uniref:hypothetical protein n=1 Tax=Haloterrigena sp. H1 TaxID=2552943 RepID=UPI00110DE544|nr:hypothetical protein [Haloterrigena sp. H1]TMT85821.1 hypothetical protein E2L06_04125 [Haloterrigena sp. H1]
MSSDEIIGFIGKLVTGTITALVFLAIFSALVTSPAALEPDDSLYEQQQILVETVAVVLPWLVPGVIGAAAVVIGVLGQSRR